MVNKYIAAIDFRRDDLALAITLWSSCTCDYSNNGGPYWKLLTPCTARKRSICVRATELTSYLRTHGPNVATLIVEGGATAVRATCMWAVNRN